MNNAGFMLCADRGYTSLSLMQKFAQCGVDAYMIFPDHRPNSHPFVASSHLQNREAQQFDDSQDEAPNDDTVEVDMNSKFIIADDGLQGPLFSITHSRVDVERSGNRKLLAFAVREHGDDKYARILRFMLHTSKDTKPMMNWVAVKKPVSKKVLGSYLFSAPLALHAGEMLVPNSKQFAENVISQNCHPLSTVQRDASWFQARRFRVTATYAANCLAKDFSGRGMLRLPEVAEQCVTLQGRLDELVTKSWFSFSRSTEAMKRGQVNEGPVFQRTVGDCSFRDGSSL